MLEKRFANHKHLLAVAGFILLAVAMAGCVGGPTVRPSHAPTYSYHQDPDALLAVERWAAISEIHPPTTPGIGIETVAANTPVFFTTPGSRTNLTDQP